VTLAQTMRGAESSGPSSSTSLAVSSSSSGGTSKNTPAIIGGVVGGIAGLAVLVVLITCLLRRSRRKPKSQTYNQSFQQNPNTFISTTPVFPAIMSAPPRSPGLSEVHETIHSLFSIIDFVSGGRREQVLSQHE
jgi:hypothetical protein